MLAVIVSSLPRQTAFQASRRFTGAGSKSEPERLGRSVPKILQQSKCQTKAGTCTSSNS